MFTTIEIALFLFVLLLLLFLINITQLMPWHCHEPDRYYFWSLMNQNIKIKLYGLISMKTKLGPIPSFVKREHDH